MVTLFLFTESQLKNVGPSCWNECDFAQGKCDWCGSEGYCCRKNWKAGNGCDGSFGGTKKHECALKHLPESGKYLIFHLICVLQLHKCF